MTLNGIPPGDEHVGESTILGREQYTQFLRLHPPHLDNGSVCGPTMFCRVFIMFSVTLTRLPSSKPPNANLALFETIVSLRLSAVGGCF